MEKPAKLTLAGFEIKVATGHSIKARLEAEFTADINAIFEGKVTGVIIFEGNLTVTHIERHIRVHAVLHL